MCLSLTRDSACRPLAAAGSRGFSRRVSRHREQGYILLTLMLAVSLMVIATTVVLTEFAFQIRRDKEQEMIHRGVQYTRAVRAYYKKYGRYPAKLEDLDNTNNLRYLRKHYKDPITGQDFKLLHYGDPGVTLGFSFGGGTIPGASAIGAPAGANGFGQNGSGFGGSSSGNSGFGNYSFGNSGSGNSAFGNSGSGNGVNSSGVFSQSSGFGGNTNSGNSNNSAGAGSNSQPNSGDQVTTPASGSDPTQASSPAAPGTTQGSFGFGGQPASGGPIVGVASVSKKTTIREFNKKTKYNDWQFIYDPSNEPRAGIIMTPNQPLLQGLGQTNLNGQQPGSTNGSSPSGTQNGFGSTNGSSGFGNNSSSFGNNSNGFGNNSNSNTPSQPAQPPANPPQQ